MKKLRIGALVTAPAMVAILVSGCAASTASFTLVGVTAAPSRQVPGELQLFTGDYTFAAADGSHSDDLRWTVTYGSSSQTPDQVQVSSTDHTATLTVHFSADAAVKRYYQVCLSSIATPATRTCQRYAVGLDGLLAGTWAATTEPLGLVLTQTGRTGTAQIILSRPYPPGAVTFDSPFLLNISADEWFEWVSPTEAHLRYRQGNVTSDYVLVHIPA